jgi:hypothetical protein
MHAGIGTHIDAPAHCIPGAKTVDELYLNDLIAPCVVIDISKQAHAEYQCLPADMHVFEKNMAKSQKGHLSSYEPAGHNFGINLNNNVLIRLQKVPYKRP